MIFINFILLYQSSSASRYSQYREGGAETHDGGLPDYFVNTVHRFPEVYHTSYKSKITS